MPDQDPESFDFSFYSKLRYAEPADEIIARFTKSLRALLERQRDDLRGGAVGEFSGTAPMLWPSLATAVERTLAHVDILDSTLQSVPAERGGTELRNIVANIVADANFAEIAEAHVAAPKAKEGKFDQERAGDLAGTLLDFSDKFWQLVEFMPKGNPYLAVLFNFIGFLMRDIGLVGKATAEPAKDDVHQQLEAKLDFSMARLKETILSLQKIQDGEDDLKKGQDDQDQAQRHIASVVELSKTFIEMIWKEVNKIEAKADTLGALLGKTLMSEAWVVDPDKTGVVNKTPLKGVKEELHEIEDLLNLIWKQLGPVIVDGPKDPPPPPPPPPPPAVFVDRLKEMRIPVVSDARLKKIFVYSENTFTPKSVQDRRTIRVQTAAFDLTGWIDLTRLQAGDEIEVQVKVTLAGHKSVLFAKTRFTSPDLLCMADFARGQNYISGNFVDLVLRQTKSGSKFKKPVEIAYQFVVESQ